MNAPDAGEVVLAETGEPLGCREITRRMLEKGLWKTKWLTPEETINAGVSNRNQAGLPFGMTVAMKSESQRA